ENLTNYGDYACSTDGVNMNTHNQACISKLEFGEPSSAYNGTNFIEMNFNAFNLSRLGSQNEIGSINEKDEGLLPAPSVVAALGIIVFVVWARRPFVRN
ncbi:MAG: hypothetical protein VX817_02630, partial [Candidatus Thermoplasmatota archaeon]|nr:hypothetical protein [Candidatus Thermoplasmatota archaeon]